MDYYLHCLTRQSLVESNGLSMNATAQSIYWIQLAKTNTHIIVRKNHASCRDWISRVLSTRNCNWVVHRVIVTVLVVHRVFREWKMNTKTKQNVSNVWYRLAFVTYKDIVIIIIPTRTCSLICSSSYVGFSVFIHLSRPYDIVSCFECVVSYNWVYYYNT